jgi:hypothetical protein
VKDLAKQEVAKEIGIRVQLRQDTKREMMVERGFDVLRPRPARDLDQISADQINSVVRGARATLRITFSRHNIEEEKGGS